VRSSTNTVVVGFEYDPIRTASLVKLYTNESIDSKYSYIIAPNGTARFQTLTKYNLSEKNISTNSPTYKLLKPGDAAPISFFEVGDFLHSLEAFPGQGSLFSRASGSYCQIRSINQSENGFLKTTETLKSVIVRLPSGKKRSISIDAQATLGRVHQDTKTKRNIEKAGRIR
jgi:large subunit ribosomal protein L2